jgi:LysM repeat protein
MSTPNPLIPQGSKLEQAAKSKSTLSMAVLIGGAHVAVFAGLLVMGCNKENKDTSASGTGTDSALPAADTAIAPPPPFSPFDTNALAGTPATNLYGAPPTFGGPGYGAAPTNLPPGMGAGYGAAPALPSADPYGRPPGVAPGMAPGLYAEPTPAPAEPAPATSGADYKIKKGDIAYNIAKSQGVTLKALKEANPTVDLAKLKVGQVIQLPAAASGLAASGAGEAVSAGTTSYTVKGGDTLTRIAKKNGVTVKAIRRANNLSSDAIKVGQKLKIPASAAAAPAETTPAPVQEPAQYAPPSNFQPTAQPLPPSFGTPPPR